MSGYAYLFVRRLGAPVPFTPIHFGHVGWAFTYPHDDTAHHGGKHYFGMCGSTENTSGNFSQPAGKDDSWARVAPTEAAMFGFMRHVPIARPPASYDRYKRIRVEKPNVALAHLAARQVRAMDYGGAGSIDRKGFGFRVAPGSNCLDHAYRVLTAYGLVTPLNPQTTLAPNDFYNRLDGPDLPLPADATHGVRTR